MIGWAAVAWWCLDAFWETSKAALQLDVLPTNCGYLLCSISNSTPTPPTRCSHLATIIFRLENNLPPPEKPPPLLRTMAAPASVLHVSVTVTFCVAGSHLSGASLVRALCQFHVGTDGSRGQMRRCDTNLSSCTNTILHKLINHYILESFCWQWVHKVNSCIYGLLCIWSWIIEF